MGTRAFRVGVAALRRGLRLWGRQKRGIGCVGLGMTMSQARQIEAEGSVSHDHSRPQSVNIVAGDPGF